MAGFGALAYDPMTGLPIGAEEAPPDAPVAPSFGPGMSGIAGETLRRLTGTEFGQPRLQLWPEKMVRSAVTLPGDVYTGKETLLPPGLRREDYTDIPAPQGPTEDSTRLGKAMGWAPGSWQPNDPVYERAQDTAGMAGGGMVFGSLARPGATVPSFGRAARVFGKRVGSDEPFPHQLVDQPPNLTEPYIGPAQQPHLRAPVEARIDAELGRAANDRGPTLVQDTGRMLLEDSATPGAPIAALENAPKFYSNAERVVEGIQQPKMTGQEWLNILNNKGVKPEEMDWTGLRQMLSEKANQPVPKAEVAAHIGENKLELGETHKGAGVEVNVKDFYEKKTYDDDHAPDWSQLSQRERAQWAEMADAASTGNTKYQSYQLTGGENYREKLLTLPDRSEAAQLRAEAERRGYGDRIMDWPDQEFAQRYRDKVTNATDQGAYKSGHWDEPNVLAHRRTNEREVTGVNGANDSRPSLHVEELQSDWHQAGRKQGYAREEPVYWAENKRSGHVSQKFASKEEADAYLASLPESVRGNVDIKTGSKKIEGVPDAPFKKNWHELALKDAVREAAEKGIDRISWTPGKAQAERYDLSQHFDELRYVKKGDDTYSLFGVKGGSSKPVANNVPAAKLADTVGKDVAERIVAGEGDKMGEYKSLSGLNLSVGGEGMKGFYDKMVPDAMNKIGKKHGVKVQSGKTPLDRPGWDIVDTDGASYATYKGPPTKEQMQRIADSEGVPVETLSARQNKGSEGDVHYMDIPQSLKDEALTKGFSLFEDATPAGAPIAALEHMGPAGEYIRLIEAPAIKKTKIIDEQGNPIQGPAYAKEARAVLQDIEKGPKGAGPMDITLQGRVPDVPQVDLPRYEPPRGVTPRLREALETPSVQEGLRQSMEAGRGVENWYHTEPVRRAFIDELGPEKGAAEFGRYMDTVAATSPRSDVPTNVRNASYYYQKGTPEALPAKNPYPYGHVAQNLHRQNFGTIAREAGWDPFQNPKPASFAQNLRGNLEPVTVDTHAFRNIAMRTGDPRFLETSISQKLKAGVERGPNSLVGRFGEVTGDKVVFRPQKLLKEGKLTMEEAKSIPTFWASKPTKGEYGASEQAFKRAGEDLGMRPADAQAAAWAGGGEMTGLGTVGTHTFPELMNERVLFTARMRGESPQKTLSDFIRGKATLLEDASAPGAPLSALEKPSAQYHALLDKPPEPAYKPADVAETAASREVPPAGRAGEPRSDVAGGAGGGDARLQQAATEAERRAGAEKPLEGLPRKAMKIGDEYFIPGPIAKVKEVANDYMATRDTPSYHKQPEKYHPLDEDHSRAIAKAFDEMKHDPDNPAVKHSYEAMINETKAQYKAIEKTGLKIEPIEPGMPDPYAANPRLAAKDVADNNHLWYFPTDAGFGSNAAAGIDMAKHPMMQPTGIKLGDRELLANDLFRIVHDYFGHLKEGYGFRAAGEDNAWRSHASMYSDLARPAMTTETRGQNSWVNYGPHGEKNRTASAADTTYADQKVGLLPEWTMRDRGSAEPTIAYHGGPHSFDKFDMSKIGTGEGNQAYGHGLYFAGHSPVSEWYRHQLSARRDPLLQKYGLDSQDGARMGIDLADNKGDPKPVIKGLKDYVKENRQRQVEGDRSMSTKNIIDRSEKMIKYLQDPNRFKGHMYEVAIDAPKEKFLNWDKPISEQPKEAQAFFSKELGIPMGARRPAGELYEQFAKKKGEKQAAEAMKAAGIPGIVYLDQASRSGGKGTQNYVTFDSPRLLKKYATGGPPFSIARDPKEDRR